MGQYKRKFNPIPNTSLVPVNAAIRMRDTVANQPSLPLSGNIIGDGRVTTNDGHLYVWTLDNSIGLLTDWVDQGNFIDVSWASIDGKPTSSVSDIDNAVSLRHAAHSDDQDLSGKVDKVSGKSLVADTEISKIHALHADDQDLSGKVDKVSGSSLVADTEIAKIHAPHSDDQVVPTALSQLSDDSTHRLVTDAEKIAWNGKQDSIGFSTQDITDISLNVMLNAFRIAQIGSLTIFNMVKGFMDEYEDESGVDLVNSLNQDYNSSDDYYSPLIDAYDNETTSLLHLDNNFTDEAGNTWAIGNVGFSTPGKFGGYAASFGGGQWGMVGINMPSSSAIAFGSDDFTIDFCMKSSQTGSYPLIHSLYGPYNDGTGSMHIIGDDKVNLWSQAGQTYDYQTVLPTNLRDGNWHHVAQVRNGSNFLLFIDGVSIPLIENTPIGTKFFETATGVFGIGYMTYGSLGYGYVGQIDEFRISKGIARWTSDFTPPTSAYIPESFDMTLFSNAQVATIVPTEARIILFEEDVDAITLNTDLKAYVSRDNGTTYSQVTLEDEGNYITGARILSGIVDISAQPSGSNIKYKIETLNTKKLNLHGTAVSYK